MTVKEKIITIEKIAALSLGNVGKYEFLTRYFIREKTIKKKLLQSKYLNIHH